MKFHPEPTFRLGTASGGGWGYFWVRARGVSAPEPAYVYSEKGNLRVRLTDCEDEQNGARFTYGDELRIPKVTP